MLVENVMLLIHAAAMDAIGIQQALLVMIKHGVLLMMLAMLLINVLVLLKIALMLMPAHKILVMKQMTDATTF